MQGSPKNKIVFISISILFSLLLVFLLHYEERRQSYELDSELRQLVIVALYDKKQEQSDNQKTELPSSFQDGTLVQVKDQCVKTDANGSKYVSITNGITKEMLTYKHWSGSYIPTTFVVTINGNQIPYGETVKIELGGEKNIVIRYDYSFVNGYKAGSREIEFVVSLEKDHYLLGFSWKEPAHLVLENALIKKTIVVPFNKQLESKKI